LISLERAPSRSIALETGDRAAGFLPPSATQSPLAYPSYLETRAAGEMRRLSLVGGEQQPHGALALELLCWRPLQLPERALLAGQRPGHSNAMWTFHRAPRQHSGGLAPRFRPFSATL
jgi:hypothetical protein